VSVLRRAWRVLADPPGSGTASLVRNLALPAVLLSATITLLPAWTVPTLAKPMDVVWVYAILWVVRQRDEARAATKNFRESGSALP